MTFKYEVGERVKVKRNCEYTQQRKQAEFHTGKRREYEGKTATIRNRDRNHRGVNVYSLNIYSVGHVHIWFTEDMLTKTEEQQ
jgi:hypothetical protein